MSTDDLRSSFTGKEITKYNKLVDDDLWTDEYVLWLEEQLLNLKNETTSNTKIRFNRYRS